MLFNYLFHFIYIYLTCDTCFLLPHVGVQRYELSLRRLHQVRAACHYHSGRVVRALRTEVSDLRDELDHVRGERDMATQLLGRFQQLSSQSPGIGGSTSRSRPQGLSPSGRNVRRRSDSSSQGGASDAANLSSP